MLFIFLGTGSPVSVFAMGERNIGAGQILFTDRRGDRFDAVHLASHVDFTISGIVAEVVLTQSFRNQTDDWREATYVMPLPETAAVHAMTMRVGERIIRSVVKEKEEARAVYLRAKAAGKKAALVEQSRPNLFRQVIANIAPGELIEVELRYLQLIDYDSGQFSLRFPMTITPRYIPGTVLPAPGDDAQRWIVGDKGWAIATDQVVDAPLITPVMQSSHESVINPITIEATIDVGMALQQIDSSYHSISVNRNHDEYKVELVQGTVAMDRDFVLTWTPVIGAEPVAAAFRERVDGQDYVLLMILPPERAHVVRALPRDMLFVIDTSGSMQGTSIEQARSSLARALSQLRPEDRFNLIEFDDAWSQLFSSVQPADPFNLHLAETRTKQLSAGGGTNMLPALNVALASETSNHHLKHIVFITDGAVGNETALFQAIAERIGNGRLFPVGIGSAPNSFFMRQAAKYGRGTYTHIGNLHETGEKMDALFKKIDSPIATDIEIFWPGDVESFPQRIPSVYRGEPLLIVARADTLAGDIHISGRTAQSSWQQTVSLPEDASASGVGSLWARKKIEVLEEEAVRLGQPDATRIEIIDVALSHSLVSRFTSLVAVEEIVSRLPADSLKPAAVANALAKGQVVMAQYPATATRANSSLIMGLISLLSGLVLVFFYRSLTEVSA